MLISILTGVQFETVCYKPPNVTKRSSALISTANRALHANSGGCRQRQTGQATRSRFGHVRYRSKHVYPALKPGPESDGERIPPHSGSNADHPVISIGPGGQSYRFRFRSTISETLHCAIAGVPRATTNLMADVISEYQKWKQQGENLRVQAKQAMEARFRELLTEAVAIAEEYRADFGVALKPPATVTAFRYKASGKSKAKKAAAKQPSTKVPESGGAKAEFSASDPKIARLRRRLDNTKMKLAETKAAGSPTRALEDRIYEIEDAIRLAAQPA